MAQTEEPVTPHPDRPIVIRGNRFALTPLGQVVPDEWLDTGIIPATYSTNIDFNATPELMRILMGPTPAEQAQRAFEDARRAVTDGLERTTNRIAELRQQRTDINEEIRLLLNQQGRLARMVRDAQGENR
jgi:hypothetical protein